MSIPDSLQEKIELFKARGRIAEYHQGLFLEPSWLAVYLGQRIVPAAYDQRVDLAPTDQLRQHLLETRQVIASAAASMPDHAEFLKSHCPQAGSIT